MLVSYRSTWTNTTNRELYTTATFKNSAELQGKLLDIFVSEVDGMFNASGLTPALVMQPITTNMISYFSKNGGNSFDISAADGPLTCKRYRSLWTDFHILLRTNEMSISGEHSYQVVRLR